MENDVAAGFSTAARFPCHKAFLRLRHPPHCPAFPGLRQVHIPEIPQQVLIVVPQIRQNLRHPGRRLDQPRYRAVQQNDAAAAHGALHGPPSHGKVHCAAADDGAAQLDAVIPACGIVLPLLPLRQPLIALRLTLVQNHPLLAVDPGIHSRVLVRQILHMIIIPVSGIPGPFQEQLKGHVKAFPRHPAGHKGAERHQRSQTRQAKAPARPVRRRHPGQGRDQYHGSHPRCEEIRPDHVHVPVQAGHPCAGQADCAGHLIPQPPGAVPLQQLVGQGIGLACQADLMGGEEPLIPCVDAAVLIIPPQGQRQYQPCPQNGIQEQTAPVKASGEPV